MPGNTSFKRVKTPTMLQMDATECGAISLAIVLGYYGHHLLPEEAREAVDVSRDGSKAINVVKAARHYGMEAEGANLDIEELKEIEPPCIAYWEFNHFLVIEGFGKDKVYINDPATGPRTISYQEFDRAYTGIVLLLEPGENFTTGGQAEPSVLKMLWEKISHTKKAFLFITLVALLIAIPTIIMPIITKVFVDRILIARHDNWIAAVLTGILMTGLLLSLLTWLQKYYLYRYKMKIKLTGSAEFFWHMINLPIKFFQQRSTGDLVERVEIFDRISELVSSDLTINSIGILTMFAYAVVMLVLSWQLGAISILFTIINFYVLTRMQRKMTDLGRRHAQDDGKLTAIEMNGIQIIETLKANALENHFFNRWAAFHAKKMDSQQTLQVYAGILRILPAFLTGLNTVILLGLGSWLIMQGQLTIGTLIALQALLLTFQQPINNLLALGNKLYELKGDLVRIRDINNHDTDNTVGALEPKPPRKGPILELRGIEFGYSKLEPPVFYDLSVTVNPGERIAIIGPSGGGKSSLVKLICGLLQPWSGDILIQGVELAHTPRERLAKLVGYVDQEVYLFAGTVRDNITLWNNTISDEAIRLALKDACIDDIIAERGGLDCQVEEGGSNFSGGQAQRLEIARALVNQPALLVLDEATSAIDTIVEKQIYENLQQRLCTLFIIAHRLSAIRDCDQIIVVNEGEITEYGTHQSLMQQQGLYYTLANLEGQP